jgi:DNA-binding IclR family transcriptional regulator
MVFLRWQEYRLSIQLNRFSIQRIGARRLVSMPSRRLSRAEPQGSPLFIVGLAKGLSLLTAFAAERPAMSLAELAVATGLAKSSVQRAAFTLESLGYLRRASDARRYELTPRSCELGCRYLETSRLVAASSPHLFDLNRRCGETVNLSEPDGTDMVFVARFPGHKSIAHHMPIGRRLPMFCTASGRAYLSRLPPASTRAVMRASERQAFTPTTVTAESRLQRLIEEAAAAGFAYADGEYYRGDVNVAAPLLRPGGVPVGAINMSVPVTRWSLQKARAELAPLIIETARAISSKLV